MVFRGKTFDFLLHLNANETTFRNAKQLRKNMTPAEKILWDELKGRKLNGLKFRRQHPLHFYIADFYCHEQRLVIEIDGEIHQQKDKMVHDENRTAELQRFGIRIIRFTNDQVIHSVDEVIQKIREYTDGNIPRYHSPSP